MKSYQDALSCEYCSTQPAMFVPPEVPDNPNIILIGEAPGPEEHRQGRPFVGESGSLLRQIIQDTGARPIVLNSINILQDDKPTTKEIALCRQAHLLPILEAHPNIPVVALGAFAAMAVIGGKRGEESSAGKVLWKFGRNVLFTYHPAYYLWSYNDNRIYEHIFWHIKSALTPEHKPQYEEVEDIPNGIERLVLDVETDSTEYPFYNSDVRVLGIMDLDTKRKFIADHISDRTRKNLSAAKLVVGHSFIFDLVHVAYRGITFPQARFFDTLIYQKHIAPKELDYGLKYLGKRKGMPPYEAEFRSLMDAKMPVKYIDKNIIYPYNANDLEGTGRLYETRYMQDVPAFDRDMKYMRLVRDMTMNGIRTSKSATSKLDRDMLAGIEKLQRKAKRIGHLGKDFNFNSHPQKKAAIEEAVGYAIPDTKKETLEDMRHESTLIDVLLDLSKETKIEEQVSGIKAKITAQGLVHSHYTPNGTETSRLSSSNPNLQNKHVKTRKVFVSRYGR